MCNGSNTYNYYIILFYSKASDTYLHAFIIWHHSGRICQRQKDPNEVLQNQINKYREVFRVAMERANLIDDALARYLEERPTQSEEMQFALVENVSIFKCPKCGSNMVLKNRKQGRGKYISCLSYPACTNAIWLSEAVEDVEALSETCDQVDATFLIAVFQLRIYIYKWRQSIFSVQRTCANWSSSWWGMWYPYTVLLTPLA